jgi:hypothetical protein
LVQCTFQPNLSKSSKSYRRCSASASSLPSAASQHNVGGVVGCGFETPTVVRLEYSPLARSMDDDLTFVPQTNGVSMDMVNAQAYLKEDVFTRLSQTCQAESSKTSSSSSGVRRSWSDTNVGDSTMIRFLERQNDKEEERLNRLDNLQAAASPIGRPELNERSLRLAERRRDRTGEQAPDPRTSRPPAEPQLEPECTFRPHITKAAKESRTRTPAQLGPEDHKRRQARHEKATEEKLKRELDVMQSPKIRNYNGIGGRLRILEDVDGLLGRIDKKREREQKQAEKSAQERLQTEMAPCSFKPEVKDAPGFVLRMAATRRAAKAQTERDNGPSEQPRPDWQ